MKHLFAYLLMCMLHFGYSEKIDQKAYLLMCMLHFEYGEKIDQKVIVIVLFLGVFAYYKKLMILGYRQSRINL